MANLLIFFWIFVLALSIIIMLVVICQIAQIIKRRQHIKQRTNDPD